MRKPERDARQGRRADVLAADGGGIDVLELTETELAQVDARLPLSRLDVAQTYLIAWERGEPVGQAHVAWDGTTLGVPEIQDVFVPPDLRNRGIGTRLAAAAEELARARGHSAISIGTSVANDGALRLYRRLGYRDADLAPQRVAGTIQIRGRPVEIDDTLVYLVKSLAVDSGGARSS